MAKNSKISWTHHTKNLWWGCTKVSSECDNCYAETWSRRCGFCTSSKEVHDACHGGGMWCDEASIDWVIIGGESGGGARPCHVETIRRLLRECRASAVVPYVKQLGAHVYGDQFEFFDPLEAGTAPGFGLSDRKGADPSEWPEDLRIQRYPPAFLRLQ